MTNGGAYPPYYTFNTGYGGYSDGPFSTLNGQTTSGSSVVSVSPDFYVLQLGQLPREGRRAAPVPRERGRPRLRDHRRGQPVDSRRTYSSFVAGFLNRSVYVDFNHNFREAATTVRRYLPPSRSLGHIVGETFSHQYGTFNGPGTQFEISDDGDEDRRGLQRVDANWGSHPVYGRMGYGTYDFNGRGGTRVPAEQRGGTDPWASKSEVLATSTKIYSAGIWRLGSVAFTRDASAIVFYMGFSGWYQTQPYYYYHFPTSMYGSLYAWTISSQTLQSILSSSDGGTSDNGGSNVTYTSGSYAGNGATTNTTYTSQFGRIRPKLSFLSDDGNFMYVCSHDALNTSDYTSGRLVGVNIKDTVTTVSGRTPLRAFAPTWPTKYAFQPESSYYYGYYSGTHVRGSGGGSCTVGSHMVGANGIMYFPSYQQGYYGNSNTYSSTNSAGPYYPYQAGYTGIGVLLQHVHGRPVLGRRDLRVRPGARRDAAQRFRRRPPATSEYRDVTYVQPSPDGTRVAYVTRLQNTSYYYQGNPSQEKLYISSGLSSSATTGAITSGSDIVLESTAGRVSASIALDSTGSRVYYGFNSGGSNENQMVLVEKTLNTTGSAVTGTRTFNGVSTRRTASRSSGRVASPGLRGSLPPPDSTHDRVAGRPWGARPDPVVSRVRVMGKSRASSLAVGADPHERGGVVGSVIGLEGCKCNPEPGLRRFRRGGWRGTRIAEQSRRAQSRDSAPHGSRGWRVPRTRSWGLRPRAH